MSSAPPLASKNFDPFIKYLFTHPLAVGDDKFKVETINQPDQLVLSDNTTFTLYHYNKGNEVFFLPKNKQNSVACSDESSNFTKKTNIIIKTDTKGQTSVVAQGFGYTPVNVITEESFAQSDNISSIYKYHEGTILRVWYIGKEYKDISQPGFLYGSGWMISTSNKILGYKNKCLNETTTTIGDLLEDNFSEFFMDFFNKMSDHTSSCFIFSLSGPETSLVNHECERKLIYLGAFTENGENPQNAENPHIFMTFKPNFLQESINWNYQNVVPQSKYQVSKENICNKTDLSRMGYVCYLKDGNLTKCLYADYMKLVEMRYNVSNWKHWWYLQNFPGEAPRFFEVVPAHLFEVIMPKGQFALVTEWMNEYQTFREKECDFLYSEYINRLVNSDAFKNELSADEEWILKRVKQLYYEAKNNSKGIVGKFYWGGEPSKVNETIKTHVKLVWDGVRGDRLYRMVSLAKKRNFFPGAGAP